MHARSAPPAVLPPWGHLRTSHDDSALQSRLAQVLRPLGAPVLVPDDPNAHRGGAHSPLLLACAPPSAVIEALAGRAVDAMPTVVLIGPPPTLDEVQALLGAGVREWWPVSCLDDMAGLAAALCWAQARADTERERLQALERVQRQLDERKWVERAKGVLMNARGLDEQAAFGLLRSAAMQSNLRLGEVSRAVAEAAGWAEAINRCGQLRALSQRLMKLAAQRWAGIEPRQARQQQDQVLARLGENLRHLDAWSAGMAGSAAWADGLAQVRDAGRALEAQLQERLGGPMLRRADAQAEVLQQGAEALTTALEQASGRRALHLVNECGRQRMRVQRIAKQALLAHLLDDAALGDALPPLLDSVEATLRALDEAPLSTAEIRQALADARDNWLRLLRGLQGLHTEAGRLAVVQAGDALLDDFERLTQSYERSLQVLMA